MITNESTDIFIIYDKEWHQVHTTKETTLWYVYAKIEIIVSMLSF
jgi:hypothetical protein